MPKTNIFIVYYSMYGHVRRLAQEVKRGAEKIPNIVTTLYQIQETLPPNVLEEMHAPPKSEDPVIDAPMLSKADAILFGIPTRFGSAPAQVKTLLDATGSQWVSGGFYGKPAGVFFSTGTLGGGQETTALTFITQLAHHGMIYVPLGYINRNLAKMDEIHGGSAYGAGTLAGSDNSRQPSALELSLAATQGEAFAKVARALAIGKEDVDNEQKLKMDDNNTQPRDDLRGINVETA